MLWLFPQHNHSLMFCYVFLFLSKYLIITFHILYDTWITWLQLSCHTQGKNASLLTFNQMYMKTIIFLRKFSNYLSNLSILSQPSNIKK